MSINLNDFARTITLKEGGKQNLSIAQVKEVLRLTLIELASMDIDDVLGVLKRYKSKH